MVYPIMNHSLDKECSDISSIYYYFGNCRLQLHVLHLFRKHKQLQLAHLVPSRRNALEKTIKCKMKVIKAL